MNMAVSLKNIFSISNWQFSDNLIGSRTGSTTSSTLTINTDAPQGCILSLLLCFQFTVWPPIAPTSSSSLLTTQPWLAWSPATVRQLMERSEPWHHHQCQQNKITDGLWTIQEAKRRRSSFRFLRIHIPDLDSPHQHHQQDKVPSHAEEDWHGLQDTLQLLQVHHREYADWLNYNLVWLLNCPQQQGSTEGDENCTAHHWDGAAIYGGPLHKAEYCREKTKRIIKDPNHPSHKLFCLLQSSSTTRLRDSFIPHAIGHLS